MRLAFWKKPKSRSRPFPDPNTPIPGRPAPLIEVDAPGLGIRGKIIVTANLVPMIHQLTAPIVWRDDPIDTRYGPARCTPECTEVHAYAVKVDATTLAFERPCVAADMGAAEYRARQKR